MRKLSYTMILVVSLIVVGIYSNQAEAQDVWIKSTGGDDIYVSTETFRKYSNSYFSVSVKTIAQRPTRGHGNGVYEYQFKYSNKTWIYTMSELDNYWLDISRDPEMAGSILSYCLNNLM